jgi:hypothetical protein
MVGGVTSVTGRDNTNSGMRGAGVTGVTTPLRGVTCHVTLRRHRDRTIAGSKKFGPLAYKSDHAGAAP